MSRSHTSRPPRRLLLLMLFAACALGAFASIVLLTALLTAWWEGSDTLTGVGISLGIMCGLIAWLFVAIFHINRESITVPFDGRQAFLRRVRAQLQELGYVVSAPSDNVLVGKPRFSSLLFGGQVVVRLGDSQAVLVGPKIYLEMLRQGCRVHNHIDHAHQSLSGLRHRPPEALLSKAEVRLPLPSELLPGLYREVAAVLAREGAVLECELCIRAQSETGLRERVVDRQVRDWLKERQVVAEVRKEPMPAVPHSSVSQSA